MLVSLNDQFGGRRITLSPPSSSLDQDWANGGRSTRSIPAPHETADRPSSYCCLFPTISTDHRRAFRSPAPSHLVNPWRSFIKWIPNFLASYIFLLLLSSTCLLRVKASALTTNVAAGERLCFYAWVDKANEKVGFYFAVQSGGSFDIDWTVTDPTDTIVIEGEKDRQGDYIFTAALVGEYSFCFNNDMSSFSEKFVDFDIMVENEPRPVAPAKPTSIAEQTSSLEDSIYKLSGSLSNIQRTQKYFRTRENRNVATVKDTQNRIFYVNVGTSLLLIGMSFTQVFIVRKFFNSPGKYVRV